MLILDIPLKVCDRLYRCFDFYVNHMEDREFNFQCSLVRSLRLSKVKVDFTTFSKTSHLSTHTT